MCAMAKSYQADALTAFTLPEPNASARIVERLGFRLAGLAHDKDAGEVWEWRG